MSLTPLPPAPSSSDTPEVFQTKAEAFVTAQTNMVTEINSGLAEAFTSQYMLVQDQKASGTDAGQATSGSSVRTLNTVVTNEITGASLASNLVTLPAGKYRIMAQVPAYGAVGGHKLKITNTTGTTVSLVGCSASAPSGSGTTYSFVTGKVTLAVATTIRLNHYVTTTVATNGQGKASSTGDVEVYAQLEIWNLP